MRFTFSMSWRTMIRTSSSNEVLHGFQPSNVLALVGSPNNCSTSDGRKYLGSTSTNGLPVSTSIPFSFMPSPSQRSSMPASLKASVAPRNAAGYGRGRSENLSLCRNEKYHFQFSPLLISFVMSCGRGGGLILFSLLRDWK